MRSPRVWLLALAASAACLGSASAVASAQVPLPLTLQTQPLSAADLAQLPRPAVVGAGPLGRYDAPAVMYGVWDPARGTAVRAFGVSDRETGTPASTDQSFRIASITKTFTATAVLLLVDDGLVRLDAPVARYVGQLVDPLPEGRSATIRRLLNMTSGFPDYGGRSDGPFTTSVLTPQRVWTPAQVVRAAVRYAPDEPGAFNYSNTNYVILGELVARVSGMPFGTFVRRRILQPLGLRHTRIPSTLTPPVALHGYLDASWGQAARAGTDATSWSTSSAGAAAGGVSTLEDLARWAAADFGDALLSSRTRAARLRRVSSDRLLRGSAYGLGLQIERGWHFHVGELFGWETLAMASPRTGRVVVVVRNACCGSAFETYLTAREAMPAVAPVVDPVYRR
jgi:D-alanyl-D-alanine carboxypeptidase